MNLPIKIPLCFFFFFFLTGLQAQYSPGINWQQVTTEHFRLIFPEALHEEAVRQAVRVEQVYQREFKDYNDEGLNRKTKWPLILTSSGLVSNGYVTVLPRKSVWFGTPAGEGLSPLGWYDILSLHETRHMVQMEYLNRRFIKFLYILSGRSGQGTGTVLAIPFWYLEGDAVNAETMYSQGGRGRDPLFYSRMQVLALNKNFNYQKYVNSSYRDYIPNQYPYGYFMVAYIRKHYGDEAWQKILTSAASLPVPALGLYIGAKRVTGLSWSKLHKNMMKELKSLWEEELEQGRPYSPNEKVLKKEARNYSTWEVLYSDEEKILARKDSQAEGSHLVKIREGKEKKLCSIPRQGGISSNGKQVVWAFTWASALYPARSWSDIMLMDLETGKKKRLTKGNRYLDPVLSPAGERLAAVFWSEERQAEIHILSSSDGSLLKRMPLKNGGFPAHPAWSADEKTLYFTLQQKEGRGIASLNLEDGSFTLLQDYRMESIKRVQPWKDWLIYASGLSGNENVMALNPESRKTFQLTNRPLGLRFPYVSTKENRLYYSEAQGAKSLTLVREKLEPAEWKVLETAVDIKPFCGRGTWQDTELKLLGEEGCPAVTEPEDYAPLSTAFRLHSWGFLPDLTDITALKLQLQFADIMGISTLSTGAKYDINEKTWGGFLDWSWRMFYPVIALRSSAEFDNSGSRDIMNYSVKTEFSFPMGLQRNVWDFSLTPSFSPGFRIIQPLDGENLSYSFPLEAGLVAGIMQPGSSRALQPRWGILEQAGGEINPEKIEEDYYFFSRTAFYLPGGIRNTGLMLSAAGQQQKGKHSLAFPYARGYDSHKAERTLLGTADYLFPIAYPDAAAGSFAYLKRIWAKLFYDQIFQQSLMAGHDSWETKSSTGVELMADFTFGNLSPLVISMGGRFSWLFDSGKPKLEFVLFNAAF